MKGYRDLLIWQKSIDLVAMTYQLIKLLPKEENYALADQMRRAAVSIPSNIAEGQGRGTAKEFIRFLYIARGSQAELETQLYLCVRLGYLKNEEIEPIIMLSSEIGKMINGLISKVQ